MKTAKEVFSNTNMNDDCCEWKWDGWSVSGFKVTSCSRDLNLDMVEKYSQDFTYCPYCGKRIKVV